MMRMRRTAILAATVLALVAPSVVLSHGDEDHGVPSVATPELPASGQPGFGAEGSSFQAVLVPEDGRTVLYLADVDTNAPVSGAVVEAEAVGWQGQTVAGRGEGVYELAWVPGSESTDVTLMISAGGKDDLVLVTVGKGKGRGVPVPVKVERAFALRMLAAVGGAGAILLIGGIALVRRKRKAALAILALSLLGFITPAFAHGDEDHGAAPTPQAQAAPGVPVIMAKPNQFLLGIRTQKIEPREVADTLRVVGRVVPDPAGYARVQPSQPARIISDPAFPIPVPGQAVKRGQVLAVLDPTLSMLEKGDKRTSLYRVESEIILAERELVRLEALHAVVPAKQIETARIRLDQLRKEKTQIAGTTLGRELLIAPVDGLLTDVHVVPGEVVTPDRVLVEIVDPTRLRIEAVIHDFAAARRISGATAATKLVPDQIFTLTLLGRSPKIDPKDQGIHVLFQIGSGQAEFLNVGMSVDVFLATGSSRMRLSVPREAITEVGGQQVVFVRTAPEIFEARTVRTLRVIGPLVEVAEGVNSGDRVVIQGVEQIKAGR